MQRLKEDQCDAIFLDVDSASLEQTSGLCSQLSGMRAAPPVVPHHLLQAAGPAPEYFFDRGAFAYVSLSPSAPRVARSRREERATARHRSGNRHARSGDYRGSDTGRRREGPARP
ncbi:MAG: hypothetical protein ACRDFX_00355 [Chloroflexota bacterium]